MKFNDSNTRHKENKLEFFSKNSINIIKHVLLFILFPLLAQLTTEWVARGIELSQMNLEYFSSLRIWPNSFIISYLLFLLTYAFFTILFKNHVAGVISVSVLGFVPATITAFKLSFRNEPFLPWDLMQIDQLYAITSELDFIITAPMIITVFLIIAQIAIAYFVKFPKRQSKKNEHKRLITVLVLFVLILALLFGVFFNNNATSALLIVEDMWMQDRYYRTNGVITGFLTNMQLLSIEKPDNYSQKTVDEIIESMQNNNEFFYENSPAATQGQLINQPDIIYIMAEGFWDMRNLPGIEYDRNLMENFDELSKESASGIMLSPSYGGGTCDVEFEVLTGFSMEYVPSGSKPYQQYINSDTFSIAWHLKEQGYDTLAIHGYGERFWNRDMVYPRLGIDDFISSEDMPDASKRRGFISDEAMVQRIIQEQNLRINEGESVFIHAITMQNHTTYSPDRYPESDLVGVTDTNDVLTENIIGQLQDCATGIYEMDKALGYLTDYLRTIQRPTIVVFFGDHLNPMSNGYGVFEDTGFIEEGDTSNPKMYETPLLIWSNYANEQIDLGTISSYNISPVTMDLYGLEKPLLFEFLTQQMNLYTAQSKGTIYHANGDVTSEITKTEEDLLYNHSVLQYDLLFGERYMNLY